MKNEVVLNNRVAAANDVLKATALLYLKEALFKEDYESCNELIANAKRFGAQQSEIDEALFAFIRRNAG